MAGVPHILVVEDQPNTAEMLTSYFKTQGYEVTSVGWGKDAHSAPPFSRCRIDLRMTSMRPVMSLGLGA